MKTKMKKIAFYLLAALMGGCVPSLYPLYTEKELVFEEKLLGAWANNESKWEFEKSGKPNSYNLTITDDEGKGGFAAHLVKLDEMLFLDLFPGEAEIKANDLYKIHLLPAHTFMKVEQIQPTLKMRMMDPETMKKMLKNDPNLLKHEIEAVKESIVLTASTQELQEFMKKHANDEGLFGEVAELKRQEPSDTDPNKIDPNATDPNDNAKEEQAKVK